MSLGLLDGSFLEIHSSLGQLRLETCGNVGSSLVNSLIK